ncbi:uncharacterized protein A4U43_C08F26040, partial [Asparagus officinalis]
MDALCASCPNCGGPVSLGDMSFDEYHLRLENARNEKRIWIALIVRISGIAAKYVEKTIVSSLDLRVSEFNILPTIQSEIDKSMVIELAMVAMEELISMAQLGEPLWTQGLNNATEILNEEEYARSFPKGLKSEASRETAVVTMDHANLVEILMDVNQWSTIFSGIVSRAITLEILSTGVAGNCDGALQM